MRYGMLGLYSAVMQALGLIVAFGSFIIGIVVIARMVISTSPYSAFVMLYTIAVTVGGCFGGLGYAAFGQLLGLWIDVEHNTRLAIRTPLLDQLYGDD